MVINDRKLETDLPFAPVVPHFMTCLIGAKFDSFKPIGDYVLTVRDT